METFKTKQNLRTFWLNHRLTLSETEKNNRSFSIHDLVFKELSIPQADNIHIFLPVHEKCEVRTWSIIHEITENYKMVNLAVPKVVNFRQRQMESIRIESFTSFKKNKWGIDEPETGQLIKAENLDIIFIPLITFDLHGHRLGYGGGFYDRYLKNCTKAIKVGLSYFEPVESIPEINDFDIAMNMCITPEKVYRFS